MKKQLLFYYFICLSVLVSAQNWSPLYLGDRYNYQLDSENYISNTIWVDSLKVNNTDSVFYLNRIVKNCFDCNLSDPDEFIIANQEQFMQKRVIRDSNEIYHYIGTTSFTIDSRASLDQSWLYDTLQNIDATVVAVGEEEIFGLLDSVKTISLSNQHIIKLSKSFGLIDFQNEEGIYQLKGIENRALGESIPDFFDFYNFEVGDVFQYQFENWGLLSIMHSFYKNEILSKQELSDSYIYEIRRVRRDSFDIMFEPNQVNFSETEFTMTLYNTISRPTNQYNRSLIPEFYTEDFICNDYPVFQYMDVFLDATDNRVTKKLGPMPGNLEFFETVKPYKFLGNSDTLRKDFCASLYSHIYKEGLGAVYNVSEILDNRVGLRLIGYVKNGDTTGTIIPDELLLLSNSELERNTKLNISPNPSSGIYEISYEASRPLSFEVFDINGRLLWRRENPASDSFLEIDIEKHPPGIYLLKVSDGNALKTMKLIKY